MKENIIITEFLYSVNDSDYYMKALDFTPVNASDSQCKPSVVKVKLDKQSFVRWCESHMDDEQGWEISEYLRFVN